MGSTQDTPSCKGASDFPNKWYLVLLYEGVMHIQEQHIKPKFSRTHGMELSEKNSSVLCLGGLSKKSNVKMSKECPKLAVMHNTSIFKKLNSWSMFKTPISIANA